jgi:hypothetical protein
MEESNYLINQIVNNYINNFNKLVAICNELGGNEQALIGISSSGIMYRMQLIPKRGEYNVYLHSYTSDIPVVNGEIKNK